MTQQQKQSNGLEHLKIDLSQWFPRANYSVQIDEKLNNHYFNKLTDVQKKLVHELIDLVKNDYPEDVKDVYYLIRVLRARKWHLQHAEKMFRNRMVRILYHMAHISHQTNRVNFFQHIF